MLGRHWVGQVEQQKLCIRTCGLVSRTDFGTSTTLVSLHLSSGARRLEEARHALLSHLATVPDLPAAGAGIHGLHFIQVESICLCAGKTMCTCVFQTSNVEHCEQRTVQGQYQVASIECLAGEQAITCNWRALNVCIGRLCHSEALNRRNVWTFKSCLEMFDSVRKPGLLRCTRIADCSNGSC